MSKFGGGQSQGDASKDMSALSFNDLEFADTQASQFPLSAMSVTSQASTLV